MTTGLCFLSGCTFIPKRDISYKKFIHPTPSSLFDNSLCERKLKTCSNNLYRIRAQQQTEGKKEEERNQQLSDYEFAERCMDGGCPVEDVQELLVRLEDRRKTLQKEVDKISDLMYKLARYNTAEDRGVLRDVVMAALSIFSKTENNYPEVGESPWSMDPYRPKKWQD
jgi:hypothetical protein